MFQHTISDRAKSLIDNLFNSKEVCRIARKSSFEKVLNLTIKSAEMTNKKIPHPDAPAVIAELKSGSCDWYIIGKMGAC